MRVLFIASPDSIHDHKWMESLQTRKGHIVFCQPVGSHPAKVDYEISYTVFDPIPHFRISAPPSTIGAIRLLKKRIRENRIEVVHILFATPNALWGLFLSVPFIITCRGSDVLLRLQEVIQGKGIKHWFFKKLFYRAFKRAASITCTSSSQKEAITNFCAHGNVGLIRTGIDVEKIRETGSSRLPEVLKGKKLIFSPRYLLPVYNPDLQLQAIQQLDKRLKEAYTFVFIAGHRANAQDVKSFSDQLQQMGVDYHIFPSLTQDEIWSVFHQASVAFMVPESDGTPNTALEALASGCPVIMGPLDYDQELFGGVVWQLRSFEAKELAEAIKSVMDQKWHWDKELAFQRVSCLASLPAAMDSLTKLYSECSAS